MRSPRRSQPSGAWKRKKARAAFQQQRAAWLAEHPHPYVGWPESADRVRAVVAQALAAHPDCPLTFRKSPEEEPPRRLKAEDLAMGYFAVECTDGRGLNYPQLAKAFKVCTGTVGCHRAKAAAVFSALVHLGLIFQTGNYSVDGRGNVYVIVTDANRSQLKPPVPMRQRPEYIKAMEEQRLAPPGAPPESDDPW